jgi:hypothetical protein
VSVKQDIIIKDACTLIDHCELGLLDIFFSMNLTVYMTPNVMAEITDPDQSATINRYIVSGHLKIDGNGSFTDITAIITEYPALTPADGSVLELALRINGTILSSDGSLRKASAAKGVTVCGNLWVIEELLNQGLLSKENAIQKLEEYQTVNSWAPKKEIDLLILKLKQS